MITPTILYAVLTVGFTEPTQRYCPSFQVVNQEILAEAWYSGYVQAYADIITTAGHIQAFNPAYMAPPRKPNRRN